MSVCVVRQLPTAGCAQKQGVASTQTQPLAHPPGLTPTPHHNMLALRRSYPSSTSTNLPAALHHPRRPPQVPLMPLGPTEPEMYIEPMVPVPERVAAADPSEPAAADKPPPLAGPNVMNVVMVGAECAPWSKTGAQAGELAVGASWAHVGLALVAQGLLRAPLRWGEDWEA